MPLPPETVARLSGLALMQAIADGSLPGAPMAATLGFRLASVEKGIAIFEGTPSLALCNPMGSVHGGWALALIDSACGCAGHTLLAAGAAYTSLETKVNFTRAILPDTGLVRCEGRVVNPGRRIITAEARVLDATNRLLAHGTSTLMVLPSSG